MNTKYIKKALGKATAAKEIECRTDIMERMWTHYDRACEKHPYFCDGLLPTQVPYPMSEAAMKGEIRDNLFTTRQRIKFGRKNANVLWNELLNEEVWEATEAMADGDTAHAVEECYDAIVVLLRTIDVLEGRQKLGKIKESAANSQFAMRSGGEKIKD